MKLKEKDKIIINSILEDVRKYRIKNHWNNNEIVLVSFDVLFKKILKDKERVLFCKDFLLINPLKHGFNGIKYDIVENNNVNLFKKISKQKLACGKNIQPQYVLGDVFYKFKRMNKFIEKELGSKLLIQSGYRSQAYQLIVFFWNLRDSNYDFDNIIKRVALPFYSEHSCLNKQAMDLINIGAKSLLNRVKFENTKEYKWLKDNANFFGFYESYSKNNKFGVVYEPWHWHFENKKDE